jgi:hypothetical protein
MKLCPQCDFIYEDDQRSCDMDGQELVCSQSEVTLDGKQSPQLKAGAAETASGEIARVDIPGALALRPKVIRVSESEAGWKRFALIAAAILLGVLVFFVYHVSSRRPNSKPGIQNSQPGQTSTASSAPETTAASGLSTPIKSTGEPSTETASEVTSADVTGSPSGPEIMHAAKAASRTTTGRVTEQKAKPENVSLAQKAGVAKRENVISRDQARAGKSENATAKKESGVSSFLKKTGRILKKPFKF